MYEGLLRLHILPTLGDLDVNRISPAIVRKWHSSLVNSPHPGSVTTAKAYRLLRTILNTALEDELIVRNPCAIKGAAVERSPERPTASVGQVFELAHSMPQDLRVGVLIAAFTGLRLGELLALRRRSIDLLHHTILVKEQVQERASGARVFGPPKTDAGYRTVTVPDAVLVPLEEHLAQFVSDHPDAFLFAGTDGQPVRRTRVNRAWRAARERVGVPELRFHDLRHTGNMLAASTPGTTTKDIMARMGHASSQAALRYQHASRERDASIAEAMNSVILMEGVDQRSPVVELRSRGSMTGTGGNGTGTNVARR